MLLAMWLMGVAMTGPGNCQFAVPADLISSDQKAGRPEWIGACVRGKADGLGVVRVVGAGGAARVFYGKLAAGMPREGMIEDHGGWMLLTGFDGTLHQDASLPTELQQNASYWHEAARAARVAAAHYRAAGNAASAGYYESRAKVLDRGPGE